jgi:hypothetical protein
MRFGSTTSGWSASTRTFSLELRHHQREGAEQRRERHGRLRDRAERHVAAHEHWRHDQRRDDLDHVVVAGGEEAHVAGDGDDESLVLDQGSDLAKQP